jgi:hypothetical protein
VPREELRAVTFDLLLAFVAFGFVIAVTPGPNNVMLLASGVNFGFLLSVPHILGTDFGTEPIDTSNPSGRLIFQMLASFADYERETIGERARAGLHRAFRNRKHAGRLPYSCKLSPDESSLEVVEDEAQVVREIITNIAEGSALYGESKRLNGEGVPSPGWRFKNGERKHGVWPGLLLPLQL